MPDGETTSTARCRSFPRHDVAAALGRGRFIKIADAAQLHRHEHRVLKNVLRVVTLGGCFVAGAGVAEDNTALSVWGGSACLAGSSIQLFRFP